MRAIRPLLVLLGAFAALAAYLYTAAALDGDGAAYVLQAAGDAPFDRAVHAGALAPLWLWVHGLGGTAANASAALWAAAGLVGIERIGRSLAPEQGPWGWMLGPTVALGAAATWQAALFVEVYGPLAALAVWAVVALRADRPVAGGLLIGWTVLVHPGAVALVPGLLLLGGRRPSPHTAIAAAIPPLLLWGALWPEPWAGPRGVSALPAFDLSPWRSLQRAWRLLARDVGITALPLVLGAIAAWPRQRTELAGVLAVVGGSALTVDRYTDNAGQLPALWLACALAPLALRWRPRWSDRRGPALAVVLGALCVLGVAEATSRHDALRRRTERTFEAERAHCGEDIDDWRRSMRRALACRIGGDPAATGR